MNEAKVIKLYGARWCPDCSRARHILDTQGCKYEYIDIEKVKDAQEHVAALNNGKIVIPTIEVGPTVLVNPTDEELLAALGIAPSCKEELYDVAIVGGGPAGISAGIYSSRERLSTLLIEKTMIGSQFWATGNIENYPGFPQGISGKDLAELMEKQVGMFGAKIIKGKEVTGLEVDENKKILLAGDERYYAKTLLIATGTTYRKLSAEGEEHLRGRGISYCATCDAPFFKNKDVIVVGGGNTAFQEGLHLSEIVKTLHVVQNLDDFTASRILQESLLKRSNVSARVSSEVIEIMGSNKVEGAKIRDNRTGEVAERKADGIFIFIGQIPNTDFLKGKADLDKWGFVKTHPASLATNIKDVFAAGDVRSGSTKQIASASGEGVFASFLIKEAVANWKPG